MPIGDARPPHGADRFPRCIPHAVLQCATRRNRRTHAVPHAARCAATRDAARRRSRPRHDHSTTLRAASLHVPAGQRDHRVAPPADDAVHHRGARRAARAVSSPDRNHGRRPSRRMMESATPQTTPGAAPLVPSNARDAAQTDDARNWSRPRALALVGVVLLIGAIPVFQSMVNHDVAWILYIADRVLHGSTLYKDIVEINPPLIVWLNIPIVALAHLVGASSIVVFRIVVLALIAGSLALSVRIIGPLHGADGADWVIMLLAACFALVAFPGYDFGQREHLLLILALPYVLLTVARARGRVPTAALAIGVGIAAGVGLAIKPFFLTLWIGLIAYAWATEKRLPWRRPEVLASGAVIVLYG